MFIHAYRRYTEKISRTNHYDLVYFHGWAIWVDCVSPPMNTIESRDQLKQIQEQTNLLMNPRRQDLLAILITTAVFGECHISDSCLNSNQLNRSLFSPLTVILVHST